MLLHRTTTSLKKKIKNNTYMSEPLVDSLTEVGGIAI